MGRKKNCDVEDYSIVVTVARDHFQKRIGIRIQVNSNVTANDGVAQIQVIIMHYVLCAWKGLSLSETGYCWGERLLENGRVLPQFWFERTSNKDWCIGFEPPSPLTHTLDSETCNE